MCAQDLSRDRTKYSLIFFGEIPDVLPFDVHDGVTIRLFEPHEHVEHFELPDDDQSRV